MNIKTSKVSVEEGKQTDPKATEASEDELLGQELEALLKGNKVPEAELEDEGELEGQEDKKIEPDEDIPSETNQSDDKVEEETDHEQEVEEKPLDERLTEFEEKFLPKEDEPETLEGQLAQFEASLKQKAQDINSNHFLEGMPKDGVFQKDGKTIYEMKGNELNDYILELQDAGRAYEAAQVQHNYFQAVEKAHKYKQQIDDYQALEQQYAQAQQFVEWQNVKTQVLEHLPELTQDDFDKIGQYIDTQSAQNPVYAAAITNMAGKLQKGVEALNALGILKRLKEQTKDAKITTPSAPDSRVESKKVKPKQSGSKPYSKDPLKMSQAEFNRMSESDLDAALAAEMDMMLGK